MKGRFGEVVRDLAAAAFLALVAAVLFAPLLGGRTLHRRDHSAYSIPLFHWMHQRYAAGQEVAWAQGMSNGEPVLDELTTLQYYPLNRLLLSVLDPIRAYNLIFVLHIFWGALGLYLLLRQRGGDRIASLLGALAGGFGGGLFFTMPWWTVIVSLGWYPWMLLGLQLLRLPDARRWGGAAVLGLSSAYAFAGGYVGMVAYAMLPLAALHGTWLWGPGWRARLRTSLGPLALAVGIAAFLSAGPILGLSRLARQSTRGQALSYEASAENSMSPTALLGLIAPHVFGRVDNDSFLGASWRFGTFDPDGMLLYVGVAGLILAFLGMSGAAQRGALLFSVGVIVLYALGRWTPFYAFFIRLPVLSHLRAPAKAAALCGPLLALFAVQGWSRLREPTGRRGVQAAAALGLLLLLAALSLLLFEERLFSLGSDYVARHIVGGAIHNRSPDYYLDKLTRWIGTTRAHLAWQGLWALAAALLLALWRRDGAVRWGFALVALLAVDLIYNGRLAYSSIDSAYWRHQGPLLARLKAEQRLSQEPWRVLVWGRNEQLLRALPRGEAQGGLAGELRNLDLPPGNTLLCHGLWQYNGYVPAVLKRSMYVTEWAQDDRPWVDMTKETRALLERRRLWDCGGVRWLLSSRPLEAPGLRLEARHEGVHLYRNEHALPPAYLATQVARVSGPAEAFEALVNPRDPRSRWARPALVEGEGDLGHAGGSVQWLEWDDHRWRLRVQSDGGPGTLVLARTYYPELWRASVNGKPVEQRACNVNGLSLQVPAGTSEIRLELHVPRQGLLRLLEALALASALAASIVAWWGGRRRV